jgi:hypothetical protein
MCMLSVVIHPVCALPATQQNPHVLCCECCTNSASRMDAAACCAQGGGGLWPDTYQLVQQYPRQVLTDKSAGLADVGLSHGQQTALFLERVEQPAAQP